jgi:hypothetical protein
VPVLFILWHRSSRRSKWEAVAEASSYSEALDQIGVGNRTHGDWLARPKGQDPNVRTPVKP